ncbi:MAG TPA: M81 family metallopeptidase [Bacteroidales bacterium]|nr:M81 family metallopeptidase [Bacteroidales bacterium]
MTKLRLISLILLLFVILLSCGDSNQIQNYRIGIATFSHETCTFCPNPTGIAEFEYWGPPLKGDDVLQADEYIEGFVARSVEYGGVDLIGLISPRGAVGGSSGSWITQEAFDKYAGGIADDIKKDGNLDGIYLSLHGAMAVTGVPKPEAEMVRRIRKVAGDIPILVTLDLHANEDHELSDAADGVIIIKRYPHYDSFYQGERAARLMIKILKGEYTPVMATRKPGVITPSVFQGTGVSPAMEIMERARRWEERMPGVYVSVAFGFAYADVPDVGATVMVITNNDQDLADQIADDMNDYIWRMREVFAGKVLPKTREGVALSIEAAKTGKTPVVIADHSDRTGNSTHILEELINQGAENFCIATIADKLLIESLTESGFEKGDEVNVNVGGYADEYAGNPVNINGILEYFERYGRLGKVAVVRFGQNNRVIITPELHQVTTAGIFNGLGIDINEIDIVSLKSRVHFRRGFYENGLAGAIFEVDAPGLGPADLSTIEYINVPKDLYPIYVK